MQASDGLQSSLPVSRNPYLTHYLSLLKKGLHQGLGGRIILHQ